MRQTQKSGEPSDDGASLVEYALLLALIAVVCLSAFVYFGNSLSGSIDRSASSIASAAI